MCSHTAPDETTSTRPRDLQGLEREITQLASHIHAATCRWLGLLAEFDRREGWAAWGCRTCAHWVSWRCGVAPVAAREHVRVAHRLEDLPLIREAFARGRLSYSKVRALTRVEEVTSERELLDLARHATAAQLERLVRAYRGVVAVEERARSGRVERWVSWSYDDDGSLCLNARLPGEEGAVLVAALEAARDQLEETEGASAEAPSPTRERAAAEAPGREDEDKSASAEAPRPTAGETRADALLLMADTLLAHGPGDRAAAERYQVVVRVDAPTLAAGARAAEPSPGACELDEGVPLAAETARRLACDASAVTLLGGERGALDVGRKRRTVPAALRRALTARDRGCRFPGCGSRRFVDNHHIEHWARGGATNLGNLVQLCRHHHRLLHEGGYTIEGHPGRELAFRRPDGRSIKASPRPPRGRTESVRELGRRRGAEEAGCVPLGTSGPFDLGLGVDALLAWTVRREPAPVGAKEAVGV